VCVCVWSTPASGQQDLSVHLDRGLSAELASGQVGVVRRADEVVRQRLVHVLVDVEPVEVHGSVLVRHEVPTEPVHGHPLCRRTTQPEH